MWYQTNLASRQLFLLFFPQRTKRSIQLFPMAHSVCVQLLDLLWKLQLQSLFGSESSYVLLFCVGCVCTAAGLALKLVAVLREAHEANKKMLLLVEKGKQRLAQRKKLLKEAEDKLQQLLAVETNVVAKVEAS
eukprot:TRINITY_DN1804_c0_g1_i3.p1 TRINITY_DN1804_c0_g1~~TRINITY_DN1804_c0_g1_i3.p1  ORF type:complete len:133 (+),score=34.39 TRINITY_DN1804_c0_g1_i3:50-448(+)